MFVQQNSNINQLLLSHLPWISWSTKNQTEVLAASSAEGVVDPRELAGHLFIGRPTHGHEINMETSETKDWYEEEYN